MIVMLMKFGWFCVLAMHSLYSIATLASVTVAAVLELKVHFVWCSDPCGLHVLPAILTKEWCLVSTMHNI